MHSKAVKRRPTSLCITPSHVSVRYMSTSRRVALWCRTCNQEFVGSSRNCHTSRNESSTLGRSFRRQAVTFDTGDALWLRTSGNRSSGVIALVMRHRLSGAPTYGFNGFREGNEWPAHRCSAEVKPRLHQGNICRQHMSCCRQHVDCISEYNNCCQFVARLLLDTKRYKSIVTGMNSNYDAEIQATCCGVNAALCTFNLYLQAHICVAHNGGAVHTILEININCTRTYSNAAFTPAQQVACCAGVNAA